MAKNWFWRFLVFFGYFWWSNQKICLTKNDGAKNRHHLMAILGQNIQSGNHDIDFKKLEVFL